MTRMGPSHGEDTELVSLVQLDDGRYRLADGVDRTAAFSLPRSLIEKAGILPIRWADGALWIAATEPVDPAVLTETPELEMVRWCRTTLFDFHMARWLVFGAPGTAPAPPFGTIAAARYHLAPDDLQRIAALQDQQGGQFGRLMLAEQLINGWQLAEVLAEQTGIPAVNLVTGRSGSSSSRALDVAWQLLDEAMWRHYEMVPIEATADRLVLAVTDPFDVRGRVALSRRTTQRLTIVITGPRDIARTLAQHYQPQDLAVSLTELAHTQPEYSAVRTVTRRQIAIMAAVAVVVLGLIVWKAEITLAVVSSLLAVGYAILVGHRLWIIHRGTTEHQDIIVTEEQLAHIDETKLPIYTILVPVRDEADMLPLLTEALSRLDYPKDRLDVKLLIEADDAATLAAARSTGLPSFVEVVVVPVADPRTKPKACNFGLQRARGEFVTIYDAEDLPEPTQLKKAWCAFQRADSQLACVQAKLSYFNASQNLLTQWFTAEYGAWFDMLLPALHNSHLPIPLGGTSNHFRTRVLRELGAWDPFNVTEDADLGIRLYRAGYRTAVLDSVTYEEANSEFVNWVRQRSRWIKGYLQTWLVHMRHPGQLRRQLGWRGFWGFQLAILGTPLMFLMNPVYWFLTFLWFATQWTTIQHLFPPGIYYLAMLNLLVGNFVFTYLNIAGAARRDRWDLIPAAILTPVYWSMMSLASWKALLQLVTRPSHWEKTVHGLVNWQRVDREVVFDDSAPDATFTA